MKFIALIATVLLTLCASTRGQDFASQVDLSPLRTLAVQHQQTIKTLDSYARQTLTLITGKSSLDGHDALFSILDIAARPDQYRERNLIKIRNVPLRKEFLRVQSLSDAERDRIVHDGTVSFDLWMGNDVQQVLQQLQATDTMKADAIAQANGAAMTLGELLQSKTGFPPAAVFPPATASADDTLWRPLDQLVGTIPSWAADLRKAGQAPPDPLPNYNLATLEPAVNDLVGLLAAWVTQNADVVNRQATALAAAMPAVNPSVYPSLLQRQVEVAYNRLGKMTIPGAAFYFLAFVCFLMTSRSGVGTLRLWGLRFFLVGYLIHTLGIGVRWWLVGSIPIKNEFESVMFSAWFGATIGILLELRQGRGILGAGASFVGWLSLVAIFTVPFVFGRDIGGEIGQANGVLMSYWLYIHVTMVTASYAMIGMGFCLSAWWLVRYYQSYGTLSRVHGRTLSGEARGFDVVFPASSGGGGTAAMGLWSTLARMAFVPQPTAARPTRFSGSDSMVSNRPAEAGGPLEYANPTIQFLAALDACNLVVLQLGFWILGAGIVCGAIWADQSWGRPWGWDPKETFALITWIVYLIVVHVRVATDDKAWWTAVLSCVGFFVMLFNWIGVNFFLVGLHSYA